MADLGVLAQIPGLAGYLQTKAMNEGQTAQNMQGALGQMGILVQIQARQEAQKQKQIENQRDQQMRAEIAALGPAPDQNALMGVVTKYGSAPDLIRTTQSSLDRQAATAAQKEMRDATLAQSAQQARDRLEQQAQFKTMEHEWRMGQAKTDQERVAETARHNRSMEGIQGQLLALRQSGVDEKTAKKTEAEEKKQRSLDSAVTQADSVLKEVADAKKLVSGKTAGWGGLLANLPNTDARNLEAKLASVKANLGFDRLQQMRQESPTGGALGQVAVQELVALQSTVASLDQLQEAGQLTSALEKIERHYTNWKNIMEKAGGKSTMPPISQTPQTPTPSGATGGWSIRPK